MGKKLLDLDHLAWAIESRARNQRSSLRLLRLFRTYEHFWKTQDLSKATQDLIGVAFSLWRAAFLADKVAKREAVFSHGIDFLEKIIDSNSISFATDKASNEWTFNYYAKSARMSLTLLADNWEGFPRYDAVRKSPMERWDHSQDLFEQILDCFEAMLTRKQAELDRIEAKKAQRAETKANRAKSGKPARAVQAKN